MGRGSLDGIELVDSLDACPKRWREVLAKLPVRSVRAYGPSADPTAQCWEGSRSRSRLRSASRNHRHLRDVSCYPTRSVRVAAMLRIAA